MIRATERILFSLRFLNEFYQRLSVSRVSLVAPLSFPKSYEFANLLDCGTSLVQGEVAMA